MGASDREESNQETYRRLKWTLFLRLVVVTFLLGATIIVHLSRNPSLIAKPLLSLYLLTGISYFITLVSLLVIRWIHRILPLVYVQILWETVFVTALIYITGGIESIFSFLYLLAVISASLLDFRRGAFLAASANSILYAALLLALYFDLISPILPSETKPDFPELISNILWKDFVAIFTLAILSSYLAEKIRTTSYELEEAKDDLIQLEALNESIVHSIASGLITLSPNNRITFMNPAAGRILGCNPEDFLGRPFSSIFPQLGVENSLAEKTPRSISYETTNGEVLLLEFSINALYDSKDREIGKLIIFSDITQLKAMEKQLRIADRLAAVGKLAAGMAHEIRNPLAAISGSVQMLERETPEGRMSKNLMQIMMRETDRLNSLINDFLVYARPTPKMIKELNVNQVIREVLQVSKNRQDLPGGIEWSADLEDGIRITSDPQLIKQIFWNLLNNSIEATREGGRISISTRRVLEPGQTEDKLEVRISDEGAGIPREDIDKIFDPFFTTREKGSGLGLSIVWRIVESMRGEIKVESEQGKGTTFIVRLPYDFPAEGAENNAAAREGSG